MKKMVLVMLAFFCFFAVTPNVFARSLTFGGMRFYEYGGGKEGTYGPWRYGPDSKVEFPKSMTRFIYTEVRVKAPYDYPFKDRIEILYRYYAPDNSLCFEWKANPELFDLGLEDFEHDDYDVFYYSMSGGWEQPGNWSVGTYTVKVWVEGNFLGQGSFRIYEDRDPIDIGKKLAMSGELKQTKKGEPYWIKGSSSSSSTHSFRVMFYVNKNWVIFFEIPKSKSGESVMWVKDSSSNPYKKRVSTAEGKKKSYGPVTKSEFEQAAWRILKHFGY